MVTQQQIAKAVGVSRTVVAKVLNKDPHYRASAETRRRVIEAARRFGYDFSQLRPLHRRQHPRWSVDLPSRVTIRLKGGRPYAQGHARVLELSMGGAKVGHFHLSRPTLPLRPFRIDLELQEGEWAGVKMQCRPTRVEEVEEHDTVVLTLRHRRLSAEVEARLGELLARLAARKTQKD